MSNLPANPQDLLGGFKRAQQRQEVAGAEGHYLKLDKTGSWLYGSDETEVEEGSLWAINPATLATGYAAWEDSEKVGEEMALLTGDPVVKQALPDVGVQWNPQTAMQLKCLDGEDEGTEVVYSTTSKGGQKAFKNILAAITARIESGAMDFIPVVTMEVDSYKHKKYGKIFTPVLKVVEWFAMDAIPAPEGDGGVEAKAEPTPEPEKEEKPRRRRKQRA